MTDSEERFDALQAELTALRAEVAQLKGSTGPEQGPGRVSRRHLLRSAGLVAAGAAGVLAGGPAALPALAANGDNVIAGQSTTATAPTSIAGSVLSDAAVRVTNYYTGSFDDYSDALQGYTFGAGLAGLYGRNDAAGGAGVIGYSSSGYGASFGGGLAPLQLQPSASSGPPTSMNHQQGELYVDSAGVLWICTASGTSTTTGTFQRVTTGAAVASVLTNSAAGSVGTGSQSSLASWLDTALADPLGVYATSGSGAGKVQLQSGVYRFTASAPYHQYSGMDWFIWSMADPSGSGLGIAAACGNTYQGWSPIAGTWLMRVTTAGLYQIWAEAQSASSGQTVPMGTLVAIEKLA